MRAPLSTVLLGGPPRPPQSEKRRFRNVGRATAADSSSQRHPVFISGTTIPAVRRQRRQRERCDRRMAAMIAGEMTLWWDEGLAEEHRLVGRPLPPPTTARPGSQAKIAVLSARAALGYELHHPLDAQHVAVPGSAELPRLRLQQVPRAPLIED